MFGESIRLVPESLLSRCLAIPVDFCRTATKSGVSPAESASSQGDVQEEEDTEEEEEATGEEEGEEERDVGEGVAGLESFDTFWVFSANFVDEIVSVVVGFVVVVVVVIIIVVVANSAGGRGDDETDEEEEEEADEDAAPFKLDFVTAFKHDFDWVAGLSSGPICEASFKGGEEEKFIPDAGEIEPIEGCSADAVEVCPKDAAAFAVCEQFF